MSKFCDQCKASEYDLMPVIETKDGVETALLWCLSCRRLYLTEGQVIKDEAHYEVQYDFVTHEELQRRIYNMEHGIGDHAGRTNPPHRIS